MDPLSITGFAGVAFLGAAVVASRKLAKLPRYVAQSEGLKVVYEGNKPEIDIVCVHGLGGDPVETWTSRNDRGAVNWTKDFLPDNIKDPDGLHRDIRVLTYGYSSKLFTGSQGGTFAQPMDARIMKYLPQALYLHSNRLIEQLADLRVGNAEKRRVIFIAHSLGGLIVKSALVHASAAIGERDMRLKGIELLTIGVLFFGTPQREMRWAKWSELLGRMFRAGMLTPLSGSIQPLADQSDLLNLQIERYKSIESNFYNFSFWEGAKSQKGGSKGASVVHEHESVPKIAKDAKDHTWRKIPLQRTHKDLAKFDSKKDSDFLEVLSCINRCLEATNYQSALERHSLFFTHIDSPRNSDVDLIKAKKEARVNMANLNPKPVRVNSSDSKKKINDKLETNKVCLNASERLYGLADLTTLTILRQMASDAFQAGDYEKAEALYKRLFVSTQEICTPCSEEAGAVLKDLAEVAVRQGRLVEATKTLHRVRKIELDLGLKEDDPEILKVTEQIGGLYESRGLHDDALLEYGKIIAQLENISGTMDVEMLRVRELEANVWRQKGKKDKSALMIASSKNKELSKAKELLRRKKRQMNGHGLKTLWPLDKASDGDAIVDIILVHGLGGSSRSTWTKNGVLWPQKFLSKDFPLSRILTWSYDADAMKFFGPAGSEASLRDHARSLIWDLSQERVEDYQIQRPIIFIAHSLGGLIVKEALFLSHSERANNNLEDVNEEIAGIKRWTKCLILAGTPHHGADTARWSAMATKLAKLTQKDGSDIIAQALARGWQVVEELQSQFVEIMQSFVIYSLWEELPYPGVGMIVEKDSALLGWHEVPIPIHANHSDMVKFKAVSDKNYRDGFRDVIRHILRAHIE